MHGYHGTTAKNADVILNSQKIDINLFVINSDFIIPKGQRIPNDLGNGFYFYYDDQTAPYYDSITNAKRYVKQFKSKNCSEKTVVLKIVIDSTEENSYLDFNDPDEQVKFIKFREKLFQRVQYNLKSSNVKADGALKRNNIDGIFCEAMIKYVYKDTIDLVLKDSYTPFYNEDRQISNFPNGREACLRNLDLINWEKTEVVEHENEKSNIR